MKIEIIKTRPGDQLNSGHVNELNEAHRKIFERPKESPPSQPLIGEFEIVEVGCDGNADEYRIRPLFFDAEADPLWALDDDEADADSGFCLEASDLNEEGEFKTHEVGDRVTCYYHSQSGKWREITAGGGSDCCGCCEFIPSSDVTLTDGVNSRSKVTVKITSSPKKANTAGTAYIGLIPFDYIADYTLTGPDSREGWMVPYATLLSFIFAESVSTGTPIEYSRLSSIVAKLYIVYNNSDDPLPYPSTTLHIELDAVADLTGLEDPP